MANQNQNQNSNQKKFLSIIKYSSPITSLIALIISVVTIGLNIYGWNFSDRVQKEILKRDSLRYVMDVRRDVNVDLENIRNMINELNDLKKEYSEKIKGDPVPGNIKDINNELIVKINNNMKNFRESQKLHDYIIKPSNIDAYGYRIEELTLFNISSDDVLEAKKSISRLNKEILPRIKLLEMLEDKSNDGKHVFNELNKLSGDIDVLIKKYDATFNKIFNEL